MEKRLDDLEDIVDKHSDLIRDLDYHYKSLDLQHQELKTFVHNMEPRLEKIVEKASSNVPRWVVWFIAGVTIPMGLAAFGEVLYGIIHAIHG